ncbi:MAG: hypothetical protein U9R17_09360 [Thermodesulfobacteriota bacterium]|nr:hypothetical protein [Thermodesulfobacteriota bacterium]
MGNPLFRCLLLFSALSAKSHKNIYLSVLCVSAVNYCNIFNRIVPLTPQATPQVTEQVAEQVTEQVTMQATMQYERIKKITKEKK